jgi:hypothetical protein
LAESTETIVSDRRLAKFVVADSDGHQIVAINPDQVRCIFGPQHENDKVVSIDLGEGDPIRVEGDIDTAASRLGFQVPKGNP